MNHIFGPVNSRRLGRSLGIDILPRKVCNFDCIYCEVGPTTALTCERKEYVPVETIFREVEEFCADPDNLAKVDVVTVTASGEPTLHTGLGRIIRFLRERTGKPVAVLINGTNLDNEDVVDDLSDADIVIPSLDAVAARSFRRLNRPAACVDLESIVEGLVSFSNRYGGELWLEVLVARDINDSEEDIEELLAVIRRMKLSRIQLNTVARPPLEEYALPVSEERLHEIAEQLSSAPGVPRVDIIAHGMSIYAQGRDVTEEIRGPGGFDREKVLDDILQMLKRRPCTAEDIRKTCMLQGPDEVEQLLDPLIQSGKVEKKEYSDRIFYQAEGVKAGKL